MAELQAAPTAALSSSALNDLRSLVRAAFGGDFTDDDWAHAIGGTHVWIDGAGGMISHGSVVERRVTCSGRPLRVGYVEAVATAAIHQRLGHGTAVMRRLGEVIREHYELGALSTGERAFYERLGWERWGGPTCVDRSGRRERTPDDDGGIMILRTPRTPYLDLDGEIVCDWRSGDVW